MEIRFEVKGNDTNFQRLKQVIVKKISITVNRIRMAILKKLQYMSVTRNNYLILIECEVMIYCIFKLC